MKNKLLLLIALVSTSISVNAQDNKENKIDKELISVEPDKEIVTDTYNKWSVELDLGQSKGTKPYAPGYFGSDPSKFLGGFQLNHFGLGARYMLSPKFGIKSHFSYDDIKNLKGSESLDFRMECMQITFEGVINAIRLFDIQDNAKRFGLLFHFGIQASHMSPKMNTLDIASNTYNSNKGKKELNGGLVVGVTPAIRIFNNVSAFMDISINSNIRQHFNWDGTYSETNNNLTGGMFTTALGLSYSFGPEKIHGDWAIIMDARNKQIDELNNRIGEIETLMNDTDKDGVPDYLDAENNSIAGVAVDTKGRMVDKNNNGVPDELEKYVDKTITNNNSTASGEVVEKLINEGYIAAYFDSNSAQPTTASSDNIGFILNFLKNNPGKSVEIAGYADEMGGTTINNKLSSDRADNVKKILIKAGIDGSRLTIVGNGIDSSVDKNSPYARNLVRKVVFKIK
jgi:OOP family OmpA-OmpF porin